MESLKLINKDFNKDYTEIIRFKKVILFNFIYN